ncbi:MULTISPECIES: class I SAM-dependent methyltransferase [Roseobacteraceae]|jgi:S-adenosylmethionine-diacylgycerolhomoserine-N-methlytransferase|uniref:Demethylrebeccamycin-D-glucose O-methyltransferase n=1 Tax=Pseudosulfitobacter pseudonitzschiae TaxID=1402135 RepID=A0A221K096_9RHOB|nr:MULTISPECIES: class I SAM-dependent methyltransferase [Roseobacteraceae]ASM72300.1 demethylrebeccamycin-D-glucose O-methyltransferase [Pseudosulfitobacter pseudonitzschiae]
MANTLSHADLMDSTYRYQRLIYDVTRRYYLLGRDRLVTDLTPPHGGRVLEIGCGTGRNLARIADTYPGCALFGLDISQEMLRSAKAKLGARAELVRADACDFDGTALFGASGFDRVVLSYSLSMIPDWDRALRMAAAQLAPAGELHVLDFGDQSRLPRWFRHLLRAWLGRFHVAPRVDLHDQMQAIAQAHGMQLRFKQLYRDYAQYGVMVRVV